MLGGKEVDVHPCDGLAVYLLLIASDIIYEGQYGVFYIPQKRTIYVET